MALKIRDYAGVGGSLEQSGKFVLLRGEGSLHLVLSPLTETPYHADIVNRYLEEKGHAGLASGSADHVHFTGGRWGAHGGGHFSWAPTKRVLLLHGKSYALGRYQGELLEPHIGQLTTVLLAGQGRVCLE